jgi:hypothetical protein
MRLTRYGFHVRGPLQLVVPLFLLVATWSAMADSGKVAKVLPQYLDLEGRQSLSPSLYDRDAYQAQLRKHPEQQSGMCFNILWRGRSQTNKTAILRVEIRGAAKGNLPSETKLEKTVRITGTSHWAKLIIDGEPYKQFGEITAWRVTLWSGDQLIGEQKSFLW